MKKPIGIDLKVVQILESNLEMITGNKLKEKNRA